MKSFGKSWIVVLLSFLYLIHCVPLVFAKDSARSSAGAPGQADKRKHAVKKKSQVRKRLKSRRASPGGRTKARKASGVRKRVRLSRTRPRMHYKKRSGRARRAPQVIAGNAVSAHLDRLTAEAAFVIDPSTGDELYAKNADEVLPIASITKLMTALVVLDAGQPLDEMLTVTRDDIDRIKHTSSRLPIGSQLTRKQMLHIALMSSENRAASALGRHYPGGLASFVAAMNAKARSLGMSATRYVEPTGLSSANVSTAHDLARLVLEAHRYPLVRNYSTQRAYEVDPGGPSLRYRNSNRLIASPEWDINLQKTGYISEAGRCLVMHTDIEKRPLIIVILNAQGKYSRAADANRIRHWLQAGPMSAM